MGSVNARAPHPDLRVEFLSRRTAAVDGTTADLRRRLRRAAVPLMVDVASGRWITPRRCVEQLRQACWAAGAEVHFLSDEPAAGRLW